MNKSQLVKLLAELNKELQDHEENVEEAFKERVENAYCTFHITHNDISQSCVLLESMNVNDKLPATYKWQYISLNFHILHLLNAELSKSHLEVLSVQETKTAKTALKSLLNYGILENLQPNLPHYTRSKFEVQTTDFLYDYTLLKFTTFGLCNCIQFSNLRMLIIPHFLQGILVALLQIAHCPLKKPTSSSESEFVMTEGIYQKLIQDQNFFKEVLNDMSQKIHPSIFIKESMTLFHKETPLWFRKAVSNLLTKILRSPKGVQSVSLAMLDGSDDDITKTWKILDIISKLILSCKKFPDFQTNICTQVLNLLNLVKSNHEMIIFERLVISCMKHLYLEDRELCKVCFFDKIILLFDHFIHMDRHFSDGEDITENFEQTVRLLHGLFIGVSFNSSCLTMTWLKPYLNVLFNFYHFTIETSFKSTNAELKELLSKFLETCQTCEIFEVLDNFLFGFNITGVFNFRNDIIIEIKDKVIVKNSLQIVVNATADVMETIYNLLNIDQKMIFFGFLLQCLTHKDKYFLMGTDKQLLGGEDEGISITYKRLLIIYKLLSQLSEDKTIQKMLKTKPDVIIEYILNVLSSKNSDPQLIFTIVMICDNLISNSSTSTLSEFKVVSEHINRIAQTTKETELQTLCLKILNNLECGSESCDITEEKTEFEKALEDVFDPLLPTRGHGLLVLSKLVDKKDKQAIERKQYLLNLFQLHLKDEDSFIYLNAVQGLTALADVFTDSILEILCEEYADFGKKSDNAQEIRMKLGESLMRVVRMLGDMAPKYKSLLLNTFLSGTKDDDYLIRASSLSNLGEVCRILNYKLGTIITEILVCIHAIITTDKALEARRAAVSVIRHLLAGLQCEMISFLKEEILPIYRTLKEIYYNDKDDIMRLQAQLALEELNENMKKIVLPKPQLHFEKKIIMMD